MLARSLNISWIISPLGKRCHEPGSHCMKEGAAKSSHVLSIAPRPTDPRVVNSLLSNVRMRLMRACECRQRTSFFRFDALSFQQCQAKTHANETIFISWSRNGNAAWNMKRHKYARKTWTYYEHEAWNSPFFVTSSFILILTLMETAESCRWPDRLEDRTSIWTKFWNLPLK